MELLENTLDEPLDEFLSRPLFCFLGTASVEGHPRISPLWFLWEDERIWILADTVGKSYPGRVEQRPEAALAIVAFDVESGLVQHVGMRGTAKLTSFDENRTYRLLRRYLGDNPDDWDPRFADLDPERWSFIEFSPETVVARDQSFVPSVD